MEFQSTLIIIFINIYLFISKDYLTNLWKDFTKLHTHTHIHTHKKKKERKEKKKKKSSTVCDTLLSQICVQ